MNSLNQTQPLSILLCALGGEGGGVLSEWLVDIARHAGYAAQATSIPGVAQRTGATTYYLEVFPVPLAELKGQRPVFGLNPLPGRLDVLVSSELLETARQIGNGLASHTHTLILTSSAREPGHVNHMVGAAVLPHQLHQLHRLAAAIAHLHLLHRRQGAR